jgi:ATP-dependent protease ClpP protease subunit
MPTTCVSFFGSIDQHAAQHLMNGISQRLMAGVDDFQVLISTSGGDVASSLTLYNYIRSVPAHVTMHNIGEIDEIGSAVFLAADTRLACPHSRFSFHGIRLQLHDAKIDDKRARELIAENAADQQRVIEVMVERTKLKRNQARQLLRDRRQTKEPDAAQAAGFIQGIAAPTIRAGADMYCYVAS